MCLEAGKPGRAVIGRARARARSATATTRRSSCCGDVRRRASSRVFEGRRAPRRSRSDERPSGARHRLRLHRFERRADGSCSAASRSPGEPGLAGHSDADVLTHAVIDALLGAAALGDIGEHFPDTDPRLRGRRQHRAAARGVAQLGEPGWRVVNVDATVICERPRLGPHKRRWRERLAGALGRRAGARQRQGDDQRGHGLRRPRRGDRRARGRHDRAGRRDDEPIRLHDSLARRAARARAARARARSGSTPAARPSTPASTSATRGRTSCSRCSSASSSTRATR